jgi:multicomponent Na+:H+ antiporter subunit A
VAGSPAGSSPAQRSSSGSSQVGLALSAGTTIAPLLFGDTLLESAIWKIDVPLIGTVKVVSSAFFDLGVYVLVIGVVLAVLVALGADPDDDEASRPMAGEAS